jgi:hypothetical protein
MGYDLRTDTTYVRMNAFTFPHILRLAVDQGWNPTGTKSGHPDLPSEWDGSYLSNNHQVILKEDALNLATALETLLKIAPETLPLPDYTDITPAQFRGLIEEFMAQCKEGNNITIG